MVLPLLSPEGTGAWIWQDQETTLSWFELAELFGITCGANEYQATSIRLEDVLLERSQIKFDKKHHSHTRNVLLNYIAAMETLGLPTAKELVDLTINLVGK